jgi:hypothetical protein
MMIPQNSADRVRYIIRKNAQYENDREFWDLSIKNKYTLILPTVQELGLLPEISGFWTDQLSA